jgi:ankyrin repeat protein
VFGAVLLALLAAPAIANVDDPPLVAAAKVGDAEAVSRLLGSGEDVETADWAGWPSLVWAALRLHDEVIEVLLDAGANIEVIGHGGKNSGTALMMAAKKLGGTETMALLLARGAAIEGTDQYDRTALMIAAKHGRAENLSFLLEQGADPSARSGLKKSPTALALARAHGRDEVVRLLEAAGARE